MAHSAEKNSSFSISISKEIYSIEAIKRAVYSMMHRASIEIEVRENEFVCLVNPLIESEDLRVTKRDLLREILDQDLRISIAAETEQSRNAILGLTFSRTGLQGE